MNNVDRLTYRNSKEAIRFAWKTIILSIVFGSAVFIIIPLTTSAPVKEEKQLVLAEAPSLVKIDLPEKEEIFEKKLVVKNKVKIQKVEPVTPSVPKPMASPVPLSLSKASTEFNLEMNLAVKTDINFKVEKIHIVDKAPEKPVIAKKTPPVETPPARDYNAIYSEREVDTDATLLRRVNPVYPRRALRRGITGSVTISCVINKKGDVTTPRVIRSTPKGYFEENCLDILDRMKYKPALLDGKPVSQRMELTFDFGIQK